jgi:hypothetical protein
MEGRWCLLKRGGCMACVLGRAAGWDGGGRESVDGLCID